MNSMAKHRKQNRRHRKRNPSLPKEIIYELLSRLPVKTLLRFRSVCKSWLSIISSHDFIKTQLSKSTNDSHFTHHQLILNDAPFVLHGDRKYIDITTRLEDLSLESHSVYSLLNEPITEANKLDRPMKNIDNWTYVVGYCNGLVCLACFDGRAFLWNPTTRESRRLPKVPEHKHAHTVFGFGYDESKDDFKVLTIIGDRKHNVSVYSSKSDCWRMIGKFPFGNISSGSESRGKFTCGAIHWVVQEKIIGSLDMKTEAYGEVLQPKYGEGVCDWTLGTFGKSLSVICYFNNRADFWVMKEYGIEESWTKLFTIPVELPWIPKLKPICISVNGYILMFIESTIVLYNPKDNTIKTLLYMDLSDSFFKEPDVYPYVESLVSPHL